MNGKLLVVLILVLISAGTAWALYETTPPIGTQVWDPADESRGDTADVDDKPQPQEDATGKAVPRGEVAARDEQREIVDVKSAFAITGRVVDGEGQPIRAAEVTAHAGAGINLLDLEGPEEAKDFMRRMTESRSRAIRVAVDAEGSFRISPTLGKGKVRLTIRARGYLVESNEVTRPVDADVDAGSLVLVSGVVIAGRVTDHAGRPVAKALVRRSSKAGGMFEALQSAGQDQFGGAGDPVAQSEALESAGLVGLPGVGVVVRTDEDGRFEMSHARPGEFGLRVTHPRHPPASLADLKVEVGELLTDLVIRLPASAAIAGKVVDVPAGTQGLRVLARATRQNKKSSESDPASALAAVLGIDADELLDGIGFATGDRAVDVGADGSFLLHGLDPARTYKVWAVQKAAGRMQMSPCADPKQAVAGAKGVVLRYVAGSSVTFQVVDARTKNPITKLRVHPRMAGGSGLAALLDVAVKLAAGAKGTVYPEGRVTLTHLRAKAKQHLVITIDALGYAPMERKVDPLRNTGEVDLGTIQLKRVPTVRVQVTDAVSGQPIAGAAVELQLVSSGDIGERLRTRLEIEGEVDLQGAMNEAMNDRVAATGAERRGRTDATGWCVMNGYRSKSVTIKVTSDAYATSVSDPLHLPAVSEFVHRVALIQGGEVEVTVLDSKGKVLSGVSVTHRDPGDASNARTTNARGVAHFSHLVPGQHRFKLENKRPVSRVRINLLAPGSKPGYQGDEWRTVMVADRQTEALSLTRRGTGTLTGIVRENGQPLRNAQVRFVRGDGRGKVSADAATTAQLEAMTERLQGMFGGAKSLGGRTDGDGVYRLQELPVGEHRLRVTHSRRAMAQVVAVHVSEGDNTRNIDLSVSIVSGRVIGPDGPVARAKVSVALASAPAELSSAMEMAGSMFGMQTSTGEIRTDEHGRFEIRGVQIGVAVLIRVTASGFSGGVSQELTVRAGETRAGIEVQLAAAGQIAVWLTGEALVMTPLHAKFVGEAKDAKGVAPIIKIITGRRATLTGLRPGKWKVTVSDLVGGKEMEQTVEVIAKKTTRVKFER